MRRCYVYVCNKGGVLYTGINTDIKHHVCQHKAELLYKEEYNSKEEVAEREKRIKGWGISPNQEDIQTNLNMNK